MARVHELESGWSRRRRLRHRPDRAAYLRFRDRRFHRGEIPPEFWDDDCRTYWERTRGPIAALAIVVPLLALYEGGLAGLTGTLRTGADAWMLAEFSRITPVPGWIGAVLLLSGLFVWQILDRREWLCSPSTWLGMVAEGCLLGVGLVGLSHLIDLGLSHLDGHRLLADGVDPFTLDRQAPLAIGFLGAGIYEEAIFRLALIPMFYGICRLLQAPALLATTTAVTASALLFALAHHLGDPEGPFVWFVFIFRWAAGVYFAWAFILRGFGVVVVAHVVYDLLVGCLGWSF